MGKQRELERILADCSSVCIGFSGGVDSVFLAVSALDVLGSANVLAVTGRSESYPAVQWETARAIAVEFSLPHLEIATDELQDANYRANPTNRCYFCKAELWSKLEHVARDRGLATVLDGSNADDARDYRPGTRAARERAVRSPLLEAGLTKSEIRELSRARGLPTWDQPSAPCLSSRVPHGLAITPERLRQIEAAERAVRELGFREFRVRHHDSVARLEFAIAELPAALSAADRLNAGLKAVGFERVLLDVDGYRAGSLNPPGFVQLCERKRTSQDWSAAGVEGEIAVIETAFETLDSVRATTAKVRHAGFRYVAIDLANHAVAARSLARTSVAT